jgi:CRP/FNR family transcriptional regulator, dissimilatory nitrate respiration regulator
MPHSQAPPSLAEISDWIPPELKAAAITVRLAKDESLFIPGDKVAYFYFVQAGELAAMRCMPNGAEAVMLTARAGEFFGEASLFLTHYTCTARAMTPCILAGISLARFSEALESVPGFAYSFTRILAMTLRRQCSRMERLRLKSATDRVLHYLTCETDETGWADIGCTVQKWAAELGLEPETLYRVLSQLEKDGMLARDHHRFRLLGESIVAYGCPSAKT